MRSSSLFFLLSCLLCLSFIVLVEASLPLFDTRVITPFDLTSFKTAIKKENEVYVITFCHSKLSQCKQFSSQYNALGRTIKSEFLTLASVDCKESSDLCTEQGITDDTMMPVIRLFSQKKVFTYKSTELKTKELSEWIWKAFPNLVVQMTASNEKKTPRDKTKARVILFTDKRVTGPLYKSLAMTLSPFNDQLVLAEVRKSEKKLLDKYGIGKQFPVVMIEPPVVPGEEERSARRYDGKLEKQPLLTWIQSFIDTSASSEDGSSAPAIPELVDQSCLTKHCSGPLCAIMFLSKDHPDLSKHLRTLATIDRNARLQKGLGRINFVWTDSVVAPHATKWMEMNFDLQAQDYPQLILFAVRKGRFAPYVGAFSSTGVIEFFHGVTKGTIRTIPLMTNDKKLTPLPAGEACPPDVAPPSSSSTTHDEKKATPPVVPKEDGELHEITSTNHASEVLQSERAWVLFFHNGQGHASTYPNLTSDFGRVAVNMKDMVLHGTVDLATSPEVGEYWGIDPSSTPVILNIPHTKSLKTRESVVKFEGDFTKIVAKDIRTFVQTLFETSNVLVINSQSMQTLMGDLQPNTPFPPKFLLFSKPLPTGEVVIPDMVKALSLQFSETITFGVASSRERDLARQFNVTKIPAVFVMSQQDDQPGQPVTNQIRVSAMQYGGNLIYGELQIFCQQVVEGYQQQRLQWQQRAAAASSSASKKTKANKKRQEEEEQHDEL